jgi:hypothetical protein
MAGGKSFPINQIVTRKDRQWHRQSALLNGVAIQIPATG